MNHRQKSIAIVIILGTLVAVFSGVPGNYLPVDIAPSWQSFFWPLFTLMVLAAALAAVWQWMQGENGENGEKQSDFPLSSSTTPPAPPFIQWTTNEQPSPASGLP
jgi:hypothetical protein